MADMTREETIKQIDKMVSTIEPQIMDMGLRQGYLFQIILDLLERLKAYGNADLIERSEARDYCGDGISYVPSFDPNDDEKGE